MNCNIFFVLTSYVLTIILSVCNGERRILGGKDVSKNHTYMVYLRKAEKEVKNYTAWLCGGALVGPKVILTSAACVKDVQYVYVIAGYDKYVSDKVQNDACITNTMKKVVYICVPKPYALTKDFTKWALLDIAVVKVDENIVGDKKYTEFCTYAPTAIEINYDREELQATDRDVLIMGWGHNGVWRDINDNNDYNEKDLKYGSTKIYDKTKCAKDYEAFALDAIIKKYMICTLNAAHFNDQGENLRVTKKTINEYKEDGCSEEENKEDTEKKVKKKKLNKPPTVGICQNDHGGPLVTWHRTKEMVIGVASLFKVKKDKCTGPFLYVSTYCTSNFLKCVVDEFEKSRRRSMPDYCLLPPKEKGFDLIERHISWGDFIQGSIESMDQTDTLTTGVHLYKTASEEGTDENTETRSNMGEVRLYQHGPYEGNAQYETFRIRPQKPLRDVGYDGK